MSKIHPGHEVLSLFGMASKTQALHQAAQKSLGASLVGAFLIIIATSLILAISTGSLSMPSLTQGASASTIDGSEAVAFQPSQAIRQEISIGYLGAGQ